MIITNYGLELHRLKEDHVETLRKWRNSDRIKGYMEYREEISPEQQQKWFNTLNPLTDFYFIIYFKNKPLGMVHANHINWDDRSGHVGLFIYDNDFIGTTIPVFASLTLLDVLFYTLGLKTLFAKVSITNSVAVAYNKRLGFKPVKQDIKTEFQMFKLEKQEYEASCKSWNNLAEKLHVEKGNIKFSKRTKEVLNPYILNTGKFELITD